MKYKLIGSNDCSNTIKTLLENRGVVDYNRYLNLSDDDLYDFILLDNIEHAVKTLVNFVKNGQKIGILVDSDCDGICSASIMYNYIKKTMSYDNIVYFMHSGKQHGISEDVIENIKESGIDLLIVPDAGTNDYKQCKELREDYNIITIVLDHHQKEFENNDAIIVNNQCCYYPNKNLSGTGIVYKFLQALDEELWESDADKYLDLVALANIGDVMDLRDFETKRLVDLGLANIESNMFKAFLEKRKFDIKDTRYPTMIEVAFYVVPLINATIRFGTEEEKEMMFRAFINDFAEFAYKPRKSKNNPEPVEVMESIYDRVARNSTNIKAKQDKEKNIGTNSIANKIELSSGKLDDKVIIMNVTDILDRALTGLVAIKIAEKYKRPVLLLRYDEEKSKKLGEHVFSGSVRNPNNSFVKNFKDDLIESGMVIEAIGHQNACGCSLTVPNIKAITKHFNEKYSEFNTEKIYSVDFILQEFISYSFVRDLDKIRAVFSSFVEEPLIVVENVKVKLDEVNVFGKNGNTHIKFNIENVEYIKFNVKDDDFILNSIDNSDLDSVTLNILGRAKINSYMNYITPQFIIDEYDFIC